MATYFYMRVSTQDKQSFERQEQVFKERGFVDIPQENIFAEKISGTKGVDERVELEKLIEQVQENDIIVFESLSRVGRSLQVIFDTIDLIVKQKKCEVRILKENLILSHDTKKNAMSTFMLNIFASIAQLERDLISERVSEALQAKKENGVILGRPDSIARGLDVNAFAMLYNAGASYETLMEECGISRATIPKLVKKLNLKSRNQKRKGAVVIEKQ